MLPKFAGFEGPCLFIREFEEVFSLIHMLRPSNDIMRMKKVMLRDGCVILKLVLLNHEILWLISPIRDTFPLARPLDFGMKSSLLSNSNMSPFGGI